ncbi:chromate efflux transporter [Mesorhizobium sp. 2RAF21]|uniref:chromate efflux transporter n=1 Tax=Mesorhizobium sp. 2RAF21 TaxID=3232995 RepID=UPI003F9CEC37
MTEKIDTETAAGSRLAEVFGAFLRLGLTSFGGPIAHLGYFRDAFVVRRKWIDEASYADLVALCQFLPGPASSQVGFSLGVLRGGLAGGIVAWAGFTLPSALLLTAFALGAGVLDNPVGEGVLHGLKLVAAAVVAQALWGMVRALTPDRQRIAIALMALALASLVAGWLGQVAAIAVGAVAGLLFCGGEAGATPRHPAFPVGRRAAIAALVLSVVLLVLPPLLGAWTGSHLLAFFDAFYRSGALVFGGGHVVLPLLQNAVAEPGWVPVQQFLAGYGAAQAVPGPLFTFAAYLGAVSGVVPNGPLGAMLALVAIFLPGLLLVYGALPFWDGLRALPRAQAAMRGANAAVVGILAAAFYDPVLISAIAGPLDIVFAVGGFLLLVFAKAPPWLVVVLLGAAGAVG